MFKLFKLLKSKLTMKKANILFIDKVNDKAVWLYEDCYGTRYLAQNKFGFRVKAED